VRERRKQKYSVAVLYTATLLLLHSRSPDADARLGWFEWVSTVDIGYGGLWHRMTLLPQWFRNIDAVAARSRALFTVSTSVPGLEVWNSGTCVHGIDPALLHTDFVISLIGSNLRDLVRLSCVLQFASLLITLLSAATRATRPIVLGIPLVQVLLRAFSFHSRLDWPH
jgi:hypothetical protein